MSDSDSVWGCPAAGVGGRHSESYSDDDGRCDWCGLAAAPPAPRPSDGRE